MAAFFSLIFKKDFYVTKRFDDASVKSQNSRIYTLLETYGCEDCMVSEIQDIDKSMILTGKPCIGE